MLTEKALPGKTYRRRTTKPASMNARFEEKLHDDNLEVAVEYLAIGIAAGILAGLFGIGGGVVVVPALVMIAKMPLEKANGTSLASLLLPVGVFGAWHYYRKGALDLGAALFVAVGLLFGIWLGAVLALKLPARDLQRAFAVFLLFVAGHLWWTAR